VKSKGIVYLVGAGPGDAGLLTLRGAELLRRAEVVVYDMLVNPELLRLAPPEAQRIARGRRGAPDALSQEELSALLIARAREGRTVVRLKGGDPYVFGRGGEEAEDLAAAGVPFEVVPGVSSVVAAPNYAGIPLTHRRFCSTVTIFTGHGDPGEGDSGLDYDQIARVPGTRVVLMGLKRIRELTRALIEHGLPGDTPVAIISHGTTGRQRSVTGTLADIAELAAQHSMTPPALTVIGEVVRLRSKLDWFEKRPLFGRRVVVTRAREQAGKLVQQLAELGAEVLEIPTIRIAPTDRKQEIVEVLLELNAYDWLVFTSPNGVSAFFDIFFRRFHDLRDIGGVRLAAVGPATAAKLSELHLQVDLMPEEAVGSKIAAALARYESVENLKICLLRAEAANPDLPRALEELGAIVDDIAIYKTVAETSVSNDGALSLAKSGADWILFTSASTVEHFHSRFDLPRLLGTFAGLKLASIGPETSKAIRAIGLAPALEAREHTADGLVADLLRAEAK
jgi:uroporphyrinogen III methyltransferase/synthase